MRQSKSPPPSRRAFAGLGQAQQPIRRVTPPEELSVPTRSAPVAEEEIDTPLRRLALSVTVRVRTRVPRNSTTFNVALPEAPTRSIDATKKWGEVDPGTATMLVVFGVVRR